MLLKFGLSRTWKDPTSPNGRERSDAGVAAGTAFLEIVGGDLGKVQDIIQFPNGQEFGVVGDGGSAAPNR